MTAMPAINAIPVADAPPNTPTGRTPSPVAVRDPNALVGVSPVVKSRLGGCWSGGESVGEMGCLGFDGCEAVVFGDAFNAGGSA
jgi:hypothetical protein